MINYNGKTFITSKQWHEQVQPTDELRLTNRAIRAMETYESLLRDGNIVELQRGEADPENGSALMSPKMLIDPTAQKAIEHHFRQTAENALQSSKENALLGVSGIRLDLIAQDPQWMATLQLISKQKELEERQRSLEASVPKLIDEATQKMAGMAGYHTVLAYASLIGKRIDAAEARTRGKAAADLCRDLGYGIGKVSDVRFGQVNTYPDEVLKVVFED